MGLQSLGGCNLTPLGLDYSTWATAAHAVIQSLGVRLQHAQASNPTPRGLVTGEYL